MSGDGCKFPEPIPPISQVGWSAETTLSVLFHLKSSLAESIHCSSEQDSQ